MPNFFNLNSAFARSASLLALLLTLATTTQAQLSYGFKTGLNFARMDGPSEQAAGLDLENWKSVTGFHIGLSVGYSFTDYLGLRGEFLYSKKGAKYTYDGPSYRVFGFDGGSALVEGNARYLININNTYLDFPVFVYGRWKDFELAIGGYGSVLIQSLGSGSLAYTNARTAILQNPVDDLEFNLDHNYRKDEPGTGAAGQTVVVKVDAKTLEVPKTLGAYYDYSEDRGNLYNSFDAGLVAGLSYYISRSLFLSVRFQYGLTDVTNNDADLSKRGRPTGEPAYSDDKDHNVVIQASVGFSF